MTTPWTPELIPVPLPPNIAPMLHEPFYKKNGRVIRATAARKNEAVCLDPTCPLAWAGASAFIEASAHTSQTAHMTRLYYLAEYVMQINPLHPSNRGKVKMVLDPNADDLPPEKRPLLPVRDGKQPKTAGEVQERIQTRLAKGIASRKEVQEELDERAREIRRLRQELELAIAQNAAQPLE